MFIDSTWAVFSSGKGGNGIISWNNTSKISKGGPGGGNGGKGGDIYVIGSNNINDLSNIDNNHFIKAENGKDGGKNSRKGKNGKSIIISLPFGSVISDFSTGEVIIDITPDNPEKILLCKGGYGGIGNSEFATSTQQTPNISTQGGASQTIKVKIDLKLIADVGFIGFPNAGKSSLINILGNRDVKVASYPFTTLTPNLAVVKHNGILFTVTDIPGIVENAHKNKGLGLSFLKHIERCKFLLIVVDGSGVDNRDPWNDVKIVKHELSQYDEGLLNKCVAIIVNKSDSYIDNVVKKIKSQNKYMKVIEVSAMLNNGIDELKDFIISIL